MLAQEALEELQGLELQVHSVMLEVAVGSQLKDYHTFLGLAMLQFLRLI